MLADYYCTAAIVWLIVTVCNLSWIDFSGCNDNDVRTEIERPKI